LNPCFKFVENSDKQMILLIDKNELYAYGTIWNGDGMFFVSQLAHLEKHYNDIKIKLHTYGGSVFDGNIMCNAIEASKANITIDVMGIAASMGAILTMSAKKVRIVDNGYIMIHAPHSGTYGNAKNMEDTAKLLRMMEKNFIQRLGKRLNQPEESVRKYLDGDNWLDAQEALELGFVSEIIPAEIQPILPVKNPEEMGESEVYNLYSELLLQPAALSRNSNPEQFNLDNNMKQLLITAFALQLTEQSSDTAFVNALKEKFNSLEGELKTAKSEKTDAEAKLHQYESSRIDTMIAEAGVSDDQKEVYKKIGETSGIDALAVVLKSQPKSQAPNISAMIHKGNAGTAARMNWDFDKWQNEDPKGLEKLAKDEPEEFQKLFNAKYKK